MGQGRSGARQRRTSPGVRALQSQAWHGGFVVIHITQGHETNSQLLLAMWTSDVPQMSVLDNVEDITYARRPMAVAFYDLRRGGTAFAVPSVARSRPSSQVIDCQLPVLNLKTSLNQ